jgi:hypothetical protein
MLRLQWRDEIARWTRGIDRRRLLPLVAQQSLVLDLAAVRALRPGARLAAQGSLLCVDQPAVRMMPRRRRRRRRRLRRLSAALRRDVGKPRTRGIVPHHLVRPATPLRYAP